MNRESSSSSSLFVLYLSLFCYSSVLVLALLCVLLLLLSHPLLIISSFFLSFFPSFLLSFFFLYSSSCFTFSSYFLLLPLPYLVFLFFHLDFLLVLHSLLLCYSFNLLSLF